MASLECNGCILTIDGKSFTYTNTNSTGAVEQYVSGYPLIGVPVGQLSGITGLPLCYVDVIASFPSKNGFCRAQTGIVSYVGNPYNPNNWTISTGATGCTGTSGCTVSLDFYVDPNYALFNQISGSVLHVGVFNFYNATFTGITISSSTPISSGAFWTGYPIYTQDVVPGCGETAAYRIEARWLAPLGTSGLLYGTKGHSANCSYCSQYEMVALP